MNSIDADIAVVGLGPAGARAARIAAEAGRRVIGFDRRATAGTPVQCAEFIPAMLGQELAG
ncbi:MAG: geranylgeranyl reductase, partial [Proteobacteria bacterium]|nr:geranylgeranyl reductase [Pseudomonadota bacterium]